MRTSQKIIIIAIILILIAIITLLFLDYKKYSNIVILLGFTGIALLGLYRYRRRKKRKLTYVFKLLNKYIPNTKYIYQYKDDNIDENIGIPLAKLDLKHQINNQDDVLLDQETINILLHPTNEDDNIALGSHTTLYKDDPKLKETIIEMIKNINHDRENNINDKLFLINLFLIGNDVKLDEHKQKIFDRMNLFKCRREIKAQFLNIKHSEILLFSEKIIPDLVHLIWLQQMHNHLDALSKKDPYFDEQYLLSEINNKIDDRDYIFKKLDFDSLSIPTKMIFKDAMTTPGFHDAIQTMDILNADTYKKMYERLVLYSNKIYITSPFKHAYELYERYFKGESILNMHDIQFMDSFNELIVRDTEFKLPTNPYAISNDIIKCILKLDKNMTNDDEIILRKSKSISEFIDTMKNTYFGEFLSFNKMFNELYNTNIDAWLNNLLYEIRFKYYSYQPSMIDKICDVYLDKKYNLTLTNETQQKLIQYNPILSHIANNTKSFQLKTIINNYLLQ